MIYKLLIEDDEGQTTDVPLIRNKISIGRSEENTICLRERNVSRRHAEITLDNGQIFIADQKSFNGVWVNGEQISEPAQIKPGDLIEVGDYHLSLRLEKDDGVGNAVPSLPPDEEKTVSDVQSASTFQLSGVESEANTGGRLVILNTDEAGREFVLSRMNTTIGRVGGDNDLEIDHASVSRNHARISFTGSGYRIKDLDSANGVRVNGEDHESSDLRLGDILELGNVQIQLIGMEEQAPVSKSSSSRSSSTSSPADVIVDGGGPPVALLGAIVVVLILGIGGFFVFFKPGKNSATKETVRSDAAVAKADTPPAPRELTDEEKLKKAKEELLAGHFESAKSILKKLILKRTDWKEAQTLHNQVNEEKPHFELLKKAALLRVENKLASLEKAFKQLKEFPAKSLFKGKADKLKLEIRDEIVGQLYKRAVKLKKEKKYFVAIQDNTKALEFDPKNAKCKALHKELEQLTSGNPPSTRNDTPEPDNNKLPLRDVPSRTVPGNGPPKKAPAPRPKRREGTTSDAGNK